jgi:hypothetical protein
LYYYEIQIASQHSVLWEINKSLEISKDLFISKKYKHYWWGKRPAAESYLPAQPPTPKSLFLDAVQAGLSSFPAKAGTKDPAHPAR